MKASTNPDNIATGILPDTSKYSLGVILETISEPFFAINENWCFTYMNAQAEKAVHKSAKALLGKGIWEVFPEAVGSTFEKKFKEAIGSRKTVVFESYYTPFEAWFEVRATPFNGGLLVSFIDNTERHAYQENIRNNEERFRTLIQMSTDAVQLASAEGKLLYSSDSVQNVLGYTPAEMQGEYIKPYIHPDDFSEFEKKFKRLIKNPDVHITAEYRVRHKDGSYIWLETTMSNHLDNPVIGALVGNFRDITQRKKQQDKLQKSERRYREIAAKVHHQSYLTRAITDNATLGLVLMDDRQRCTFMNPAAEAITGYTSAEIQELDLPLHDIIHHTRPDGTHYPMAECPIDSALPRQNQTQGEDIFVHKSGSFYPVAFTASPITENGIPTGTVIEFHDTSEEKRSQTKKQELEKLTKALARQRNKLIELNKAKDEFISLASHQLRTPATGVKQYVNMVIEGFAGELNERQLNMLRTANESNERQLKIIDDLLRVARVDAGKVKPKFAACNLVTMLEAVIDEHRSIFQSRKQTVAFTTKDPVLAAMVDERLVRMVLENIIDNASKYTPEGKNITVNLSNSADRVHIDITDEGVGISPKDTHLLFTKFSRIDNPLSAKVGGTGLGLYWSRIIVELHGGTIGVVSDKDKGSTFTICLPKVQTRTS